MGPENLEKNTVHLMGIRPLSVRFGSRTQKTPGRLRECILLCGIEKNYMRYCGRHGDRRELNFTKGNKIPHCILVHWSLVEESGIQ